MTNDKHLEKQEAKSGDHPLAGAQITKSEDSAVKQRQEQLDGLKSHRITKDGNAFTIDMGNGDTVQDVRAGKAAAEKPAHGILPGEGDYMPKTDSTSPPFLPELPSSGRSDFPLPGKSDAPVPDFPLPGKSDAPIPDFPLPGKSDAPIPDFPLPGKSDASIPNFPPPGQPDFPIPEHMPDWTPVKSHFPLPDDFSKVTVKTDTSIDKQGHIVTTETHVDGSTLSTAQEMGKDSQLHVVSTEQKDANGDTTVSKFDSATGRKTEEIKDTVSEHSDTKYNTGGQPEIKDTTNKLTGHTDHEVWIYENAGGACLFHFKNGTPANELLPVGKSEHLDGAQERGELSKVDAAKAAEAGHEAWMKYADKYLLSSWDGPDGHQTYDKEQRAWFAGTGKDRHRVACPPLEAYQTHRSGLEDVKYMAVQNMQNAIDVLSDSLAGITERPSKH